MSLKLLKLGYFREKKHHLTTCVTHTCPRHTDGNFICGRFCELGLEQCTSLLLTSQFTTRPLPTARQTEKYGLGMSPGREGFRVDKTNQPAYLCYSSFPFFPPILKSITNVLPKKDSFIPQYGTKFLSYRAYILVQRTVINKYIKSTASGNYNP